MLKSFLHFPFQEAQMFQDIFQHLLPDIDHRGIAVGCFQVQYKEKRVIIFFNPAHDPAQHIPVFAVTKAGLDRKSVV